MATREEIYTAIRNADAAGDSAAVRKLGDYLKTLPPESVAAAPPGPPAEVPGSPESIALHKARLAKAESDLADETSTVTRTKRVIENLGEAEADWAKGATENSLNLGSQVVATPIAGLAGAIASPLGFVPGMEGTGTRVVKGVQNALTYEPRSDMGKAVVENIAKPFVWFAGKADQAGDVAARATGSPLVGTIVNTGIQAIPTALSRGTRGAIASAGRAAIDTVRGGEAAATTSAASAAAQAESAAAATKAQNYAGSLGLDWNSLADGLKGKLTDIARTAGELEKLSPEAVKRQATLSSLKVPVPATRGQVLRDPVQLRNEANAAATDEGAPIRDIHLAQDNALQANLDTLRGRVAGSGESAAAATTPQQAGGVIQGAARAKEAASQANYNGLYKAARETEPNARAPIAPVTDLLTQNPEIQHLGWVQTWLNRAAKLAGGKEGEPVALTDATLKELADLRSQSSAIARTGGKEGYYAGQVSRAIDEAMQSVPEGAKAWKAANDAFKAHMREFSDQGAVAKLVDDKTLTDRKTALEGTVDTITNGSLEDIQKVKRTLLTGGDEATRTTGKQAWREVRTQVLDRIKREATKSATEKADGTPNVSVAKLKQVIDSYGPEKLDEIFGPGNAREIYRILDAAKVVKTMPAQGLPVGSSTLQNMLAFLGKGLEKVPGGGLVKTGAAVLGKVKQIGADARAAESANLMPLDEAVGLAKKKGEARLRGQAVRQSRGVPVSSIAAGESRQ